MNRPSGRSRRRKKEEEMSKRARLVAGCALMAILAGLTYGKALAQTSSSAKKKVIWTYGSINDVDSMNQFIMVSTGYIIHSMAYDFLTTLSVKDFSPQPDIADSWTTSPDG